MYLQAIDQPWNPEGTQFAAAPRFIAVFNNKAEDVANTIRQVYAGRIQTEGGGQRGNPQEEFLRAVMGRRGGPSNNRQNLGEELKMTIGVDVKSNSIIVAAPDYLFQEVKTLVEQLDDVAVPADQVVRTVTLKRANAGLVEKSLAQRLGTSATIRNATVATSTTSGFRPPTSTSSSSSSSSQQGGDQSRDRSREDMDQVRQRMEVFNALRGMSGDGGRSGFGGPPGGFSGRSSFGGFPGGGFGGFPSGFSRGGDFRGGDRGGDRDGDRGGRGR
jgi:hypothetical protein